MGVGFAEQFHEQAGGSVADKKSPHHHAGLAALDQADEVLPQATVEAIQHCGVALKGPCTTPVGEGFTSVNVQLRQRLNLFAAVRPVRSLAGVSTRFDGVDLVINGHDHYYQRTYAIGNYTGKPRRGVYHLISGGGGAGTYPIVPKIHAAYRRRVHHITVMDVQDDRIVGRAVDIDGNIFDAFVYDKQAESAPEEFIAYEMYLLERDLGEAIRKLPVIKTGPPRVDEVLEVPNPFQAPVRMTFSWQGTNGWHVTPQAETRVLEPGSPIRLPIRAEGQTQALYPVPTARLEFATPEGKKVFRTDPFGQIPLSQ